MIENGILEFAQIPGAVFADHRLKIVIGNGSAVHFRMKVPQSGDVKRGGQGLLRGKSAQQYGGLAFFGCGDPAAAEQG